MEGTGEGKERRVGQRREREKKRREKRVKDRHTECDTHRERKR